MISAIIVDEPSALVTKAVIGAAGAVISSGFHGLVSALSAAVPSLACGWSHKYRELMVDYGMPDMLVDLDTPAGWEERLAAFVTAVADPATRPALASRAARERARSEEMWDEVVKVIA